MPSGYDSGRERLPVALELDGPAALASGFAKHSLDKLPRAASTPLRIYLDQASTTGVRRARAGTGA